MYQASREARELKEFEASRHLVYINAPPNQESLTALLGILKIFDSSHYYLLSRLWNLEEARIVLYGIADSNLIMYRE